MLEALRSAAKSWIAKILFALLILSFAVWGIGDVVRGGISNQPAIVAGDVEVPAEAVVADYRRELSRLQRMFGNQFTEEQARQMGLLDSTIRQMSGQALLDQASRALDMVVTDEAVLQSLASNPAFRNELGQFDRYRLRQVIAQAGYGEDEFIALARADLLRGQLLAAVSGGVSAPDTLVQTLFAHRGEKRIADLLRFPAEAQPTPEAPDAAVLTSYHESHTQDFMAPEYRAVTALVLRPEAVADQITVTDQEVADAYAQRAADFVEPERRALRQVVFAGEDQAKFAADLIAEGKDLAALAEQTGEPVVDLGVMDRAALEGLSADLAEAVFALAQPGVTKPVKTPFGWHVVAVGEIQPGKEKPLAEVADQVRQDLVRERAVDRLYELANTVDDTLASGASLEEAGQKLDIKTLKIAAIDSQGRGPDGAAVAGLPPQPAFLKTIFATEEGTDSLMTELEESAGFFIVRIDKVTAPAVRPFETVRDAVLKAWQAEQRLAAARSKAEQALAALDGGTPLAEVAQSFGVTPETTQPFTRSPEARTQVPAQVVSAAFGLQSGGAALVETGDGAAVAVLQKIMPADPQADAALMTQIKTQLGQAVTSDVIDQYLAALQSHYGLSVNNRVIQERLQ